MRLHQLPKPFDSPEWVFELKHDGFRALAYIENGHCRLISRRGIVYKSFDNLKTAMGRLRVKSAVLDGEIVCLDSEGRSVFNQLLYRKSDPVFYAFDLLWLNGEDLRDQPLVNENWNACLNLRRMNLSYMPIMSKNMALNCSIQYANRTWRGLSAKGRTRSIQGRQSGAGSRSGIRITRRQREGANCLNRSGRLGSQGFRFDDFSRMPLRPPNGCAGRMRAAVLQSFSARSLNRGSAW